MAEDHNTPKKAGFILPDLRHMQTGKALALKNDCLPEWVALSLLLTMLLSWFFVSRDVDKVSNYCFNKCPEWASLGSACGSWSPAEHQGWQFPQDAMGVSRFLSCWREGFNQEKQTTWVQVYLAKQSKYSKERLAWVAPRWGSRLVSSVW